MFELPGSGVRSGTGTAEDPYVISGWRIVPTLGYGIRFVDTRAHVVVEDVRIEVVDQLVGENVGCAVEVRSLLTCPNTRGIDLERAENVTVRRALILGASAAFHLQDTAHVAVEDVRVAGTLASFGTGGPRLRGVTDVTFHNLTVEDAVYMMSVRDSVGVSVDASLFRGGLVGYHGPGTVHVMNSDEVAFRDNRFENAEIAPWLQAENLHIIGNRFTAGEAGIHGRWYEDTTLRDVVVCGNRIEDVDGHGIHLSNAIRLDLRANRITNASVGIDVDGTDIRIEGNLLERARYSGMRTSVDGLEVHGNAFVANARGASIGFPGGNLTGNWWGDASGPSGMGPGMGDTLTWQSSATVTYEPWLTEPPTIPDACA